MEEKKTKKKRRKKKTLALMEGEDVDSSTSDVRVVDAGTDTSVGKYTLRSSTSPNLTLRG